LAAPAFEKWAQDLALDLPRFENCLTNQDSSQLIMQQITHPRSAQYMRPQKSNFLSVKQFSLAIAGMALACFGLAGTVMPQTSAISDPSGDAVFPTDIYNAPVPPYLDIVEASVSAKNGVFQFAIKVNSQIPMKPEPEFSVSPNHLAAIFGVLTDKKTAGRAATYFGQNDSYHFNFYIGAFYSFADNGIGLPLGWTGFLIGESGVVVMPLQIKGNTFVVQTSAASLGSPPSFQWVVGTECDPVPVTGETRQTAVLVDFAPDHDYENWPSQ
jgi:hypothetical protein